MTRIVNELGPPPWLTSTLESTASRNAWSYAPVGMTKGIYDAIASRSDYYPPEAVTEPVNGVWALEARDRHFTMMNGLHRANAAASLHSGSSSRDGTTAGTPENANIPENGNRTSSNNSNIAPDNPTANHNHPPELNHSDDASAIDGNSTRNRSPVNGISQMDGRRSPEGYHNPDNDTPLDDSNQTRDEPPTPPWVNLRASHPFIPVGGLRLPNHWPNGPDFIMQGHAPSDRAARCRQVEMKQPYCFGQWYEREGPIIFAVLPAISCNFVRCCDGRYRSQHGEVLEDVLLFPEVAGDGHEDQEVNGNGVVHH
ncbi:hypothetical protein PV08_00384 [Exophiala spinifera]|uniref:Uncharacterized protein n=1 Tax=Exophiala spinifera TaxID=91928 RepID=A0A0D2C8B0_9EURO|nr:uncharacterized protein PV08_00384 [Exophiala spinifera]KIW19809.1 hypothetical protein PV08_00384 [Exophiala spinifera]